MLTYMCLNLAVLSGLRCSRPPGIWRNNSPRRKLQQRWQNKQKRIDNDTASNSETQPRGGNKRIGVKRLHTIPAKLPDTYYIYLFINEQNFIKYPSGIYPSGVYNFPNYWLKFKLCQIVRLLNRGNTE